MTKSKVLLLAVSTVAFAACNPFHHADPVQVSTKDAALNTRWHANLASPADLERLLQEIRTAASVTTRTTVVQSTPYENRPPAVS